MWPSVLCRARSPLPDSLSPFSSSLHPPQCHRLYSPQAPMWSSVVLFHMLPLWMKSKQSGCQESMGKGEKKNFQETRSSCLKATSSYMLFPMWYSSAETAYTSPNLSCTPLPMYQASMERLGSFGVWRKQKTSNHTLCLN